MKTLTLTTSALYLVLASSAFAASNSLIISQAAVGSFVPTLNFSQVGGTGVAASVIQKGNNIFTGVQLGTGALLNAEQDNLTSGPVNTINYTGHGNSDVTIDQRAANGVFTATGSAGNTANIDMQGNLPANSPNKMFLDQVGFNNTATIYDAFPGSAYSTGYVESLQLGQYSDNVAAGNQLQIQNNGVGLIQNGYFLQKGGNKANVTITGGDQNITLTQINTADNIASANVANIAISGAGFNFTQSGTSNTLTANMNGTISNYGLVGWQSGTGNQATITQTPSAYMDLATGPNYLYQVGTDNIASATQNNTHNSQFTISQNGVGNNATIVQSGTSNIASLTQTGNLNVASLTQSGTGATAIIAQH